jgi:hypothetical protein
MKSYWENGRIVKKTPKLIGKVSFVNRQKAEGRGQKAENRDAENGCKLHPPVGRVSCRENRETGNR